MPPARVVDKAGAGRPAATVSPVRKAGSGGLGTGVSFEGRSEQDWGSPVTQGGKARIGGEAEAAGVGTRSNTVSVTGQSCLLETLRVGVTRGQAPGSQRPTRPRTSLPLWGQRSRNSHRLPAVNKNGRCDLCAITASSFSPEQGPLEFPDARPRTRCDGGTQPSGRHCPVGGPGSHTAAH